MDNFSFLFILFIVVLLDWLKFPTCLNLVGGIPSYLFSEESTVCICKKIGIFSKKGDFTDFLAYYKVVNV